MKLEGEFYMAQKAPGYQEEGHNKYHHSRGELRLIKAIVQEYNWTEVFKGGDIM